MFTQLNSIYDNMAVGYATRQVCQSTQALKLKSENIANIEHRLVEDFSLEYLKSMGTSVRADGRTAWKIGWHLLKVLVEELKIAEPDAVVILPNTEYDLADEVAADIWNADMIVNLFCAVVFYKDKCFVLQPGVYAHTGSMIEVSSAIIYDLVAAKEGNTPEAGLFMSAYGWLDVRQMMTSKEVERAYSDHENFYLLKKCNALDDLLLGAVAYLINKFEKVDIRERHASEFYSLWDNAIDFVLKVKAACPYPLPCIEKLIVREI